MKTSLKKFKDKNCLCKNCGSRNEFIHFDELEELDQTTLTCYTGISGDWLYCCEKCRDLGWQKKDD